MSQHAYFLTAGIVFLLIAIGHLSRVLFSVSFVVQQIPIPMWASAVAFVVMAYLAYQGLRLARRPGQH